MFVYRLSEPIDSFDGLVPLSDWLVGDPGRSAWVLQAVIALGEAADTLGWERDMRHLPMIGGLPTLPSALPYMLVKQDNNGDTFIVCPTDDIHRFDERALVAEVATRSVGAWAPDDSNDDLGEQSPF